jgi:Zn-dependent peptidase ImmA (M78 family)
MTSQSVDQHAEEILRQTGSYKVPVPIEVVAHRLGLTTEGTALGDGVSGMLVVENDRGAIGYNSSHARVRQRFTVAHEIAHFRLHLKKNRRSQLFIDPFVIFRRDHNSTTGNDREEIEANQFGAALLMPATLVLKEIKKNGLDLDDDDALSFLAKRFRVSTVAMTYRLNTLGLLRT